jgi:hypothetical protein
VNPGHIRLRNFGFAWGIILLAMDGCGHDTCRKANVPIANASGQWVLESYNENSGYTFRKDGAIYLTRCDGVNYGYGKGAEPVQRQFQCSPVLAYLHKPVPSLHLGFPGKSGTTVPESTSALYFDDNGRQYLFLIVEAK